MKSPHASPPSDTSIELGIASCDPRPMARRPDNILVVSDVRLVRETLVEVLAHALTSVSVHGVANLAQAFAYAEDFEPAWVLVDATLRDGLAAASLLHGRCPTARLVMFGVDDDATKDVTAWSEARIVARVGRSLALKEIVEQIRRVISNDPDAGSTAALAPKITGGSRQSAPAARSSHPMLTAREDEVVQLIVSGASNKEIARLLDISVATVKSHVHNLLGKLGLPGRGKLAVGYRSAQWLSVVSPGTE